MVQPRFSLLSLVALLFFFTVSFGQDPVIQINIKVVDEMTGTGINGATAEIFKDGQPYKTLTSTASGKFPLTDVPINFTYTIYINNPGYVTKIAEINGHYDKPEDLPAASYIQMETVLFNRVDDIDYSFLETEPMIRFAFNSEGYPEYDRKYTMEMLRMIEDARWGRFLVADSSKFPLAALDLRVLPADTLSGHLNGSMAKLFIGDSLICQYVSDSAGIFQTFYLPVNQTYTIRFERKYHAAQIVVVDTHFDAPEKLESVIFLKTRIHLFKADPKKDYTFFLEEPVMKFSLTPEGRFDYDHEHAAKMARRVKKHRKQA